MSEPGFDPADLRIPEATVNGWLNDSRAKPKPPRPRPEQFVKAPLDWLARAGALPGKALAVGLALWFLRGVKKRTTVRLTGGTLEKFNVERRAAYRAVCQLEGAGLIRVVRHRGKGPSITILDAPAGPARSVGD
jgi:hypothetical protein